MSEEALTKTKKLVKNHSLNLQKTYGQNFLTDERVLDKIVYSASLSFKDEVFEIGAGLGALTTRLASVVKSVTALELDWKFIPVLKEELKDFSNVEVVQGDILRVDFAEFFGDSAKKVVVANLPYSVATPAINRLLDNGEYFSCLFLMVQKEVADRIAAKAGTKDYGILSLAIQSRAEVTKLFDIPKTAFFPQPKITSQMVRFDLLEQPKVAKDRQEIFFKVVNAAFRYRRKTIKNALTLGLGLPEENISLLLEKANISPTRRGETLSLDEFRVLAEFSF